MKKLTYINDSDEECIVHGECIYGAVAFQRNGDETPTLVDISKIKSIEEVE